MRIEITEEIARGLMSPNAAERIRAAQMVTQAVQLAQTCTCGHNAFWHGQEPRQPLGSGACDECECGKFEAA